MTVSPVLLVALRLILVVIFAVSGLTKLTDRDGFKSALASFAVPEKLRPLAAVLIPISELVISLGLLPATSAWAAAIAALGLLTIFTTAIIASLVRGKRPECHCFGQLSAAPMSWKTVLRNGILVAIAVVVVARGSSNPEPSAVAWTTRLTLPEVVGLAVAAAIAGVISIQTWMLVHVLRQNGRLVLRLDAVEASLARPGITAAQADLPSNVALGAGLPVGVPAPEFRLERLEGGTSTMRELLAVGKPVVVTFVAPDCGPCTALLPELAQWQHELTSHVTLAVITTGTAQANDRKLAGHGLTNVLLQKDREVSEAYRVYGTPSTVLIEPEGVIGSPVAGGRDAIRALMARFTAAAGSPSDTNGRKTLKLTLNESNGPHTHVDTLRSPHVGEAAPDLCLPDLGGRQVSLAAFRGHATLVLFWNPECGFCQRMLHDLKTWEEGRVDRSPRLLVVSAGGTEANRAMSLRSPVLLDDGFGTGRAFGAGGTPSAVLVDRDGLIASEVAVGGPAVLALAAGQAPALGRSI